MASTIDDLGTNLGRAMLALALAALGGAALGGCDGPWTGGSTKPNPRYCDDATACTDPAYPVCDVAAKQCNPAGDGGGPVDMTVPCTGPSMCPVEAPVCEGGKCRACAGAGDDGQCAQRSGTAPRCGAGGRCQACRMDTAGTDCAVATPVCDGAGGVCRACQGHGECGSGACLGTGACAPKGMVSFVDNGGKAVADCKSSGAHDGSSTSPFCDVQDAIGPGARPYVVIAGSARPYGAVTIGQGSYTFLGPVPASSVPRASIRGGDGVTAVAISGKGTSLTMSAIDVSAASTQAAGITCSVNPGSNASLAVSRSWVHDNNGAGIFSSGCALTVDASTVASNQGGGIKVVGGTYTITNSFITGNGTAARGVSLDDASMGRFAFNTVVGNQVGLGAGVGGIDCGQGLAKVIEDSIVIGNTAEESKQLVGKCTLTSTVVGMSDTFTGGVKLDPAFVSAKNGDFHLLPDDAANAACCIDKVMTPATPNDHDVDGSKRPKGAAWDIGAHEAK